MSPRRRDDADHPPDEGRRARLLRATTDQLRAVGARRLSIEDVAAEAGVSKGAVYLEFPSKTALIEAALDAVLLDAGVRYAERMASVTSPRERLVDVVHRARRLLHRVQEVAEARYSEALFFERNLELFRLGRQVEGVALGKP